MPYRKTITEAYDAGAEAEYNRLTENPLRKAEYQLILELLDEYIPDGSSIIDIGSGPGDMQNIYCNETARSVLLIFQPNR